MAPDLEPYDEDPLEVHGLIKNESGLFLLTRWTSNELYYVPYNFIREHYPQLLTTYLVKNTAQMDLTDKR